MATPLSPAARAFRVGHAAIAAAFLLAIAYVWWCALTGRRDLKLKVAVGALVAEGVAVGANRGDCPLGGLQDGLGDATPLFELVLSPRAARRAVPVLGGVTAAGIGLLAHRAR
jgi:hypothetical protein